MNRDPAAWIARLIALGVLVAIGAQTLSALGVTGAFDSRDATVMVPVPAAYQSVDQALDRRDPRIPIAGARDPFQFRLPPREAAPPRVTVRSAPLVRESDPILTAIVWDNDPRALVRWKDREWTVREGGLFDEFQVVSITRDQVRLMRGDVAIVLERRNPGE